MAASMASPMEAPSATLAGTPIASPPAATIDSTVEATTSASSPHTATDAPSDASSSAVARPIPCEPPVMKATLPLHSPIDSCLPCWPATRRDVPDSRLPMMTADDVVFILDRLEAAGIATWLDGGWAVDAVLGDVTRD